MKTQKPWWRTLLFRAFRAWCWEQFEKNTAFNQSVKSRPVLRRKNFLLALAEINKAYDGEPRKARRRMAFGRARRLWQESRLALAS